MSPHVSPVMLSHRVGYYNSLLLPQAMRWRTQSGPILDYATPVETEEACGPRVLTGCGARKAAR